MKPRPKFPAAREFGAKAIGELQIGEPRRIVGGEIEIDRALALRQHVEGRGYDGRVSGEFDHSSHGPSHNRLLDAAR